MGGLVAKMQVQSSGENIWNKLFVKPLKSLAVGEENRETLRSMLIFEPNPDIRRVVFIACPHKGSEVAADLAWLASWLVKLPTRITGFASEIVTLDPGQVLASSVTVIIRDT